MGSSIPGRPTACKETVESKQTKRSRKLRRQVLTSSDVDVAVLVSVLWHVGCLTLEVCPRVAVQVLRERHARLYTLRDAPSQSSRLCV